ncbi:RNase H domain-containing protein [Trichonephila clavipes]|nr:RNase H domain-containing protein [Trichonephila clavipes]
MPNGKKDQNKAWNRFRRYPTPDNMIAFNKARARARKIHRQHKGNVDKICNVERGEGEVEFFLFKRGRLQLPTNPPRTAPPLHRSGNTAAGPDGLHYIMLRHLSESSIPLPFSHCLIASGKPTCFPHSVSCPRFTVFKAWQKDPTSAINYRPIALTSCLSKLMERMIPSSFKDLKIRSANALNILKVLANTHWGADRTSLLRLYRALIRSKLTMDLWSTVLRANLFLKILDPVHHQALRLCLGAFLYIITGRVPFMPSLRTPH